MDFLQSKSNLLGHAHSSYVIEAGKIRCISIYPGTPPFPFVFDSADDLAINTLDEFIFWQPSTIWRQCPSGNFASEVSSRLQYVKSAVYSARTSAYPTTIHLEGITVYLCHPFGQYAYGHLLDTLQRLYSLSKEGHNQWQSYKFLVSGHDKIVDFYQHLDALTDKRLNRHNIIQVDRESSYTFDTLLFGLPASYETQLTKDSHHWLIDKYRNYFLCDAFATQMVKYRLYLTRNHVAQGARGVINEQEILEYIIPKGYIVLTGNEPLFQIVHYFSNAEIVFGAHGSLFANTIFCRDGAKIIEYCASSRVDKSFLNKRKEARDYTQIIVESDSSYNIEIPVRDIP